VHALVEGKHFTPEEIRQLRLLLEGLDPPPEKKRSR
jgi:hypothetical protein